MGAVRRRGVEGSAAGLITVDFRRRFPLRLWRPPVNEEVDAEFEFHMAMRCRELMARGLTEAQARQAALEKFGDYRRAQRECRAIGHQRETRMRLVQYLAELRQDTAFAFRQMLAAPGFSLVAIATLALGIGATTAIFSVLHAVVFRPLAVADPDRLVVVSSGWRGGLMPVAPAHYLHLAGEQEAFQAVAAVDDANFTLARDEGAERVVGALVTGGFFDVFGVPPALGRVFGMAEDQPGADQVLVLSHALWTRQFARDPSAVGRVVSLDQRPYTIIGIMPPSFDVAGGELWVPMALTAERRAMRGNHFLTVYARLRDGVSVEQAAGQMPLILQRRLETWPDESAERTLHVTPLLEQFVGEYRERLLVMFAAVVLVLLIACGNVANLLLARGAARGRELAVRCALGAGQGRLVRQLLTESVVLGLLSAGAGLALAGGLIGLLIAFSPPGVPRLDQARIDGVVLTFALVLAFAASLIFGLIPAWRAARADVNTTLKEAGRGAGSRGARDIVRSTLVAGEVALALVLLVGAGLLIRTAIQMQRIDPGFDAQGVFTGRVLLAPAKYQDAGALWRVSQELEEAVGRIPGVEAMAVASAVPGARSFSNGLLPEGLALDLKNITQSDGVIVSPRYFQTMRLPIVEGRGFADTDREGAPLVVILNRTAAAQMWPGQQAVGKRLTSANPLGPTTVIGIAEDVRLDGPSSAAPPTFYVPFAQMNDEAWASARAPYLVARTNGDPSSIAGAVRRVVAGVDPGIPLFSTLTMEERMGSTIESARFNTVLLALLGGAGLLLAGIGIYGVVAYFAAQRSSEIGIRMALGASRSDVIHLVVRQAAVPVLVGTGVGALGAVFASRALAAQLVDIHAADPLTFLTVAAGLLVVALVAAMIPARRAASLNPVRALQAN